ncbi:MAG TPA: MAPEG family protein [Caulobacteraceae bacterium]|jgi:uncharacterized MAPEG superfamily protein
MLSQHLELLMLLLAVLIGVVQIAWAAIAARRQQGLEWARGPRDEPRPATGAAARLERAFANFQETFPLFAASVLVVIALDETGRLSAWGSIAYVLARIAYVPLYAAGVPRVRSLVWFIGFLGLLMVWAEAFV